MLAHGISGRSDLPVPQWIAIYTGILALVVSFLVMVFFRKNLHANNFPSRKTISPSICSIIDSSVVDRMLKSLTVLALILFLTVAWGGSQIGEKNPVATWLYAWFWVGLIPVCLLSGQVYKKANPLRTISSLIRKLLKYKGIKTKNKIPDWAGYKIAFGGLGLFLWLELVYITPDLPLAVAIFSSLYVLVNVLGGVIYGPIWHAKCDSFEVIFSLVGQLSCFGRTAEGEIVLRSPVTAIKLAKNDFGATSIVLLVLGATTYDGLSKSPMWISIQQDISKYEKMITGTLGLVAVISIISLFYLSIFYLTKPYIRTELNLSQTDFYVNFCSTLIPVMVGYSVAHYFSFLFFQGQNGYLLATDPFYSGIDIFGIASWIVNYTFLSTTTITVVQVGAIILGHIFGVVAAHDRSIMLLRSDYIKIGQFPMLALMAGYTIVGIQLVTIA
ncbi:MAG: hypothetical protein ACRCSF_08385 [Mycobacteriaceae bacterium]